ncbi:MAG: DUF5667 domain-containing protein [Dehalococcoidia bacterium]
MKNFEEILAQCIDDIKAGRSSIEGCLTRYPSLREQLDPLLKIALEIREPPDVKPSPAFKIKARVQLMEQIHDSQPVTKWPWSRYNKQTRQIPLRRRFGMVSIIVAIVLTLSAVGGGTAYASQASLPGDTLYQVKLSTEQIRMMLPGGDVLKAERALTFAERRVNEMEALAENGRSQHLALAVEGYERAMTAVTNRLERASDEQLFTGNLTARVAEATARHLSVLDRVYDMMPNEEAKAAITRAREMSQTGRENALAALARNKPMEATQFNLAAMEGRLNRIRERAMGEDVEAVEVALEQFEAMAEFGEEISQIAQGIGINITGVEELIAAATSIHLEILAEVWERLPEHARPTIEEALARAQIRHERRVQALAQKGIEAPHPHLSEMIQERVRERVENMLSQTMPLWPTIPGGGSASGRPCPGCRR